MSTSPAETSSYREIIFNISGEDCTSISSLRAACTVSSVR